MRHSWIAVAALMVASMVAATVSAEDEAAYEEQLVEERGEAEPMESMADDEGDAAGTYVAPSTSARTKKKADDDILPLKFQLHGYYRVRYNWQENIPLSSRNTGGLNPKGDASYGYMRLRLEPEVVYGPNEDLPIARLQATIDGLDNVVFGDNARVFSVPLFATNQSITNIDGTDWRSSVQLTRVWMEFLVPVGQIRVGRMESHFGEGLLTHAGNDLAEWGDFLRGETFDRILFITRPLTVGRAIKSGDSRKTPLIYAFGYDRLSQNPVIDSSIASFPGGTAATAFDFQPFFTTFPALTPSGQPNSGRSLFPLEYLTTLNQRTNELINVVAWFDEDYGRAPTDELFAGVYVVYRWQDSTASKIPIVDAAFRLKHTLKRSKLRIFTAGEFTGIVGKSGALAFTDRPGTPPGQGCPPAPCPEGNARIFNVLARVGVEEEGKWATHLEGGFASGDESIIGDNTLKTRAFNTNIKVGLLMYQVALKAVSVDALGTLGAEELGANGSVWNSKYFYPSYRVTIVNGLEFHTTFLLGWAHQIDNLVLGNVGGGTQTGTCGFKKRCFYGWEWTTALRARMGKNDIVWIDLEGGLMQPGQALTNTGLQDTFLWTIQLRSAMIW